MLLGNIYKYIFSDLPPLPTLDIVVDTFIKYCSVHLLFEAFAYASFFSVNALS